MQLTEAVNNILAMSNSDKPIQVFHLQKIVNQSNQTILRGNQVKKDIHSLF